MVAPTARRPSSPAPQWEPVVTTVQRPRTERARFPVSSGSATAVTMMPTGRVCCQSVTDRFDRMRLPAKLGVVAASVVALACSSAVKHLFSSPTVAFRGVALEGISPFGGRVRVNLLVRNPNPYSLSTSGMTYELFVRDTIAVARGVDTLRRTVGGHDSLIVDLPLDVSLRGLALAANSVVGYGAVPYRLIGDITADTPIGSRKIPFDQKGEFAPVRVR